MSTKDMIGTVRWFDTKKAMALFKTKKVKAFWFTNYRAILIDGFKNLTDGKQYPLCRLKGWQAAEVELIEQ